MIGVVRAVKSQAAMASNGGGGGGGTSGRGVNPPDIARLLERSLLEQRKPTLTGKQSKVTKLY